METQTLCPNGFPWCGLKEKAYSLLCTLIQPCCIYGDFVVDLTIGTCIIQFKFQISLDYVVLFVLSCSSLLFFIHA